MTAPLVVDENIAYIIIEHCYVLEKIILVLLPSLDFVSMLFINEPLALGVDIVIEYMYLETLVVAHIVIVICIEKIHRHKYEQAQV